MEVNLTLVGDYELSFPKFSRENLDICETSEIIDFCRIPILLATFWLMPASKFWALRLRFRYGISTGLFDFHETAGDCIRPWASSASSIDFLASLEEGGADAFPNDAKSGLPRVLKDSCTTLLCCGKIIDIGFFLDFLADCAL